MKLFRYITSALVAAALATGFTACSDDDALLPVETPTAGDSDATFNSLTFHWSKVEGANQYGYKLTDPSGREIVTDVINTTSATITGLQPDTEYTLHVWAYGAYGIAGISDVATITKRTNALVPLATPALTYTDGGTTHTIAWDAIAGAESYAYTLSSTSGYTDSGTTTSTSLNFRGLAAGTYTLTLRATTTAAGHTDSPEASLEFTITRVLLWSAKGKFNSSATSQTYDATICAYDGGTYVIENWYGVEGYDFEFRIASPEVDGSAYDEENTFIIPESLYQYDEDNQSFIIPTGLASPESVLIYPYWNYSYMEGTQIEGAVYLWDSTSGDYDSFTWGATVDAICGDWNLTSSGYQYLETETGDYSFTNVTSITRVNDHEVSIQDLYWTGYPVSGTVDFQARTITFPVGQEMGYYTWGTDTSCETGEVVATISEDFNTITMTDFNFWYSGYTYLSDAKAVWTR